MTKSPLSYEEKKRKNSRKKIVGIHDIRADKSVHALKGYRIQVEVDAGSLKRSLSIQPGRFRVK
jgi:hypothetical protein